MKTRVQENIPLSRFTTLGIGGSARYFADARSEDPVLSAIDFVRTRGQKLMILGGGSNVLVSDEGFPGLVVRVMVGGVEQTDAGPSVRLRAGAGVDWDAFVARAVGAGLFGIECLSGIPGWVGGTPVQNVGAYGQEVADVITSVRAYDREDETVREMIPAECGFGYRQSLFNTTGRGRYVVLAVEYGLTRTGRVEISYPDLERMFKNHSTSPSLFETRSAVLSIRAAKAMLCINGDPDAKSAGSFFKNPVLSDEAYVGAVDTARRAGALSSHQEIPHRRFPDGSTKISAAWLIEACGYSKGTSDGAVGLSTKHALALINRGGATARDVIRFAGAIQSRVEERFGIHLVAEPAFAGFADDVVARFGAVRA